MNTRSRIGTILSVYMHTYKIGKQFLYERLQMYGVDACVEGYCYATSTPMALRIKQVVRKCEIAQMSGIGEPHIS